MSSQKIDKWFKDKETMWSQKQTNQGNLGIEPDKKEPHLGSWKKLNGTSSALTVKDYSFTLSNNSGCSDYYKSQEIKRIAPSDL